MASYEVEHDIKNQPSTTSRPRRPDLSSFFNSLSQVETSGTPDRNHNNSNAVPTPAEIQGVFRNLRDAFSLMQQDNEGENSLLDLMIGVLNTDMDAPPREVKGVSDEWLASLDRIPKKSLKKGDTCPICNNAFLDDKYPLVVRLPCHKTHVFDLECIQPWLKLHPTCPLDRKDLIKKKAPVKEPPEEAEEEWDDMYA